MLWWSLSRQVGITWDTECQQKRMISEYERAITETGKSTKKKNGCFCVKMYYTREAMIATMKSRPMYQRDGIYH